MGRLKELFLIHGVYPVSDLLFHTHVSRWFSRIKRMLVWRPEQISDWQTRRMRELVANAYQYSPYYRQLFDSLSLKPEDIRTRFAEQGTVIAVQRKDAQNVIEVLLEDRQT